MMIMGNKPLDGGNFQVDLEKVSFFEKIIKST